VWRARHADKHDPANNGVRVKIMSSYTADVAIAEPGVFQVQVWTRAIAIGTRKAKATLRLDDKDGKPLLETVLKASHRNKVESYQFAVESAALPATLRVKLSSHALLKRVEVCCVVLQQCAAENADFSVAPYDETALTPTQRATLAAARAKWPDLHAGAFLCTLRCFVLVSSVSLLRFQMIEIRLHSSFRHRQRAATRHARLRPHRHARVKIMSRTSPFWERSLTRRSRARLPRPRNTKLIMQSSARLLVLNLFMNVLLRASERLRESEIVCDVRAEDE
jgi:hypothetical protein